MNSTLRQAIAFALVLCLAAGPAVARPKGPSERDFVEAERALADASARAARERPFWVRLYESAGRLSEGACEERAAELAEPVPVREDAACRAPEDGVRRASAAVRPARVAVLRAQIEELRQEENAFFKGFLQHQAAQTACQRMLLQKLMPSERLAEAARHDPEAAAARARILRDLWDKSGTLARIDEELGRLGRPGSAGARGVGAAPEALRARHRQHERQHQLETARENLIRSVFLGGDPRMREFIDRVTRERRAGKLASESDFLARASSFGRGEELSFTGAVLRPMSEEAARRAGEINADSRRDYSRENSDRAVISRKVAYLRDPDALRNYLEVRGEDSAELALRACDLEQTYRVGPEFVRSSAQTGLLLAAGGAIAWAARGVQAAGVAAAGTGTARAGLLASVARSTAGRGLIGGVALSGVDVGDALLNACSSDRARVDSVLVGDFCSALGSDGSTERLVARSIESTSCKAALAFAAMGSLGIVGDGIQTGKLLQVAGRTIESGTTVRLVRSADHSQGGFLEDGRARVIGLREKSGELFLQSMPSASGRAMFVSVAPSDVRLPPSPEQLTPSKLVNIFPDALERASASVAPYFRNVPARVIGIDPKTGKVTVQSTLVLSGRRASLELDPSDLSLVERTPDAPKGALASAQVFLRAGAPEPKPGQIVFFPNRAGAQVAGRFEGYDYLGRLRIREGGQLRIIDRVSELSDSSPEVYRRGSTPPLPGQLAFIRILDAKGSEVKLPVTVLDELDGGRFLARSVGTEEPPFAIELGLISRSAPEGWPSDAVSVTARPDPLDLKPDAPSYRSATSAAPPVPSRISLVGRETGFRQALASEWEAQIYLRPRVKSSLERANEDAATAFVGPGGPVAVSADGMGGHEGGALASKAVIESVQEAIMAGRGMEDGLREAGARIDRAIALKQADPEAGATVVVAEVLGPGRVRLTSVGDSRGVQIRAGAVIDQTKDQSFVQTMVDEGVITPDEALKNPYNHLTANAVQRNGISDPSAISRREVSVQRGDFIVLASDGLWDNYTSKQVAELLSGATTRDEAYVRLLKAVREAKLKDDDVNFVILGF